MYSLKPDARDGRRAPRGRRFRRGLAGLAAAVFLMGVAALPASAESDPGSSRPAKPDRPSVTAVSHDSVTLSWNDPADGSITGYQILRREPAIHARGQFQVLVADTQSAATSYTDDTVEASAHYRYRVRAINAAGTSARSRSARVDTLAAPEPVAPIAPVALGTEKQNLEPVESEEPTPEETTDAESALEPLETQQATATDPPTNPEPALTVDGGTTIRVNEGTQLSHQIAVTLEGFDDSAVVWFDMVNCCPWLDGWDADPIWFDFAVSQGGVVSSTGSYRVLDYEYDGPAQPYELNVQINASDGENSLSVIETFYVEIVDVEEVAPLNFTATGQTDTTITLSWDRPDGAELYDYYYWIWVHESGDGDLDSRLVTILGSRPETRTVDRLEPGTSYDFMLVARSMSGDAPGMGDALTLTHSTNNS